MKTRFALILGLAAVAAACGGTSESVDSRPAPTVPITTTAAPAATTLAPTTAPPVTEAPEVGAIPVPSADLLAVRSAIKQTEVEPPSRVEGVIQMKGTAPEIGDIDFSIPIATSFDPVTGDGHMAMDFGGLLELTGEELPPEFAGFFDDIEMRQIGETAYLKFGFFNAMFGVETEWLSMPVEDGQGFTEGFTRDFASGVDPFNSMGYLGALEDAGGEVTVIGTEELRGSVTTHYLVEFDLEALKVLDPEAFDELTATAPIQGFDLPLDIWIDDLNRVHRFRIAVDNPDLADLAPGESLDEMLIQFDFMDFGGRVTVEPPPDEDVTDISEIEDMFESMFGELGSRNT